MPLDLTSYRRAVARLGVVAVLAIPGCSSLSDLEAALGTGGAERAADPPTGVWSYFDGGFVSNTCGTTELYRDPDTQFVLVNEGGGTFVVQQGQDYGDFPCTVEGEVFICPERLTTDMPVEGTNATLFAHVSIDGMFEGDESMAGEQIVDISCEGSDCALAPAALDATLPCQYTVSFTAEFAG
jgi:hypothetical protein